MSRYRACDLLRLGENARRQIDLARMAFEARDKLATDQAKLDREERLKPPKFGNKRIEYDGRWFDSKLEAERYADLKLMQRSGRITELVCQPVFPITVNGVTVAKYHADFEFYDQFGVRTIEDVKSPVTAKHPLYRLKKKLVEALYGIDITEYPP